MGKDVIVDGLKVVMLSALLSEAIDDMKGTNLYKQNIKKAGNNFQKMLEPFVRQVDGVYESNPELATNLFRETEEFIEKIAKLNLVDFVMMNRLREAYIKDPRKFQEDFPIELKKINT
ncbi:hypothetical protein SAMN04489761_4309 [Tenacibaculum sp. MAR_2009_124]|uniref:hypothetical protein n=1 Tax=Tenacibaculum sp. MAR_2009_124 TaxID=1250059 RepID=UPI000894D3DE|nr:hypothetical protein [Tenacibaculum sp. MAR_2009_124]SED11141.1 hypothetical protein SAMN04489761_4309 [Tenacibaculum sp. MAR_2009_124]